MSLASNTVRVIVVSTVLITLIPLAGCVSEGGVRHPTRANSDTVDLCYTRATHTECFRQSATDYAEEVQSYQERLEMESMERAED